MPSRRSQLLDLYARLSVMVIAYNLANERAMVERVNRIRWRVLQRLIRRR